MDQLSLVGLEVRDQSELSENDQPDDDTSLLFDQSNLGTSLLVSVDVFLLLIPSWGQNEFES